MPAGWPDALVRFATAAGSLPARAKFTVTWTRRRPSPRRRRERRPRLPGTTRAGDRASLVLGRYRLERRSAPAASARCGSPHDEHLDRDVAVKVVPRSAPRTAPRAEREALAAARLNHPGDRRALRGRRRRRRRTTWSRSSSAARRWPSCEAAGALSDRDVVRIGLALCDALAHAHARGVVHRDVKPPERDRPRRSRERGGVAKLTDFGIARLAGDDAAHADRRRLGTLAYMAPEQAEGRRVGPRGRRLRARPRPLRGARRGQPGPRARRPAATARRLGAPMPPLGRARAATCPAGLVRGGRRAPCVPRPAERGLALRATLRRGAHAGAVLEASRRGRDARRLPRARPALAAGAAPRGSRRRRAGPARPPSRPRGRPSRAGPRAAAAVGAPPRRGSPASAAAASVCRSPPHCLGWHWPSRSSPSLACAARRRSGRRARGRGRPGDVPAPPSAAPAGRGRPPALAPAARARRAAPPGSARSPARLAARCARAALGAAGVPGGWRWPSRSRAATSTSAPRRHRPVRRLGGLGRATPSRRRWSHWPPAARSLGALVWAAAALCCRGSCAAAGRWRTASPRRAGPGRSRPPAPRWRARRGGLARPTVASPGRRWPRPSRWRCAGFAAPIRRRWRPLRRTEAHPSRLAWPGAACANHERAQEPREQDRRPRRGRVRSRLPVRGAAGRDRAQARAGDGGAQGGLRLAGPTCRTSTSSTLSPEDRERFDDYEGALVKELSGLPARARPPREARAALATRHRVPHRRAPVARRVRHPGAAWSARRTLPRREPEQGDVGHTMIYTAERLRPSGGGAAAVRRPGRRSWWPRAGAWSSARDRRGDRPQPRLRRRARRRQRLPAARRDPPRPTTAGRSTTSGRRTACSSTAARINGARAAARRATGSSWARPSCASSWSRSRTGMTLEPVSVALKFGFLIVLYLFLLWIARSALKDLRRGVARHGAAAATPPGCTRPSPAWRPIRSRGPRRGCVVEQAMGMRSGDEYDLSRGAVLGRGDAADIRLEDPFASSRHCRISRQGDVLVIEDLGSTNGTYLNGELARRAPAPAPWGPHPHRRQRVLVRTSDGRMMLRVAQDQLRQVRHRPPAPQQRGPRTSRRRRCSPWPTGWAAPGRARWRRKIVVDTFGESPGLPGSGVRRGATGHGGPGGQRAHPRRSPRPTPIARGWARRVTAAYVGDDAVSIAHVGDSRALPAARRPARAPHDRPLARRGAQAPGPAHRARRPRSTRRSPSSRARWGPSATVEVDTLTYPARRGDVFLLCSDGLTWMVPEDRIAEILTRGARPAGGGAGAHPRGQRAGRARQHHRRPLPARGGGGRARTPRPTDRPRSAWPRPRAEQVARGAGGAAPPRRRAGRCRCRGASSRPARPDAARRRPPRRRPGARRARDRRRARAREPGSPPGRCTSSAPTPRAS